MALHVRDWASVDHLNQATMENLLTAAPGSYALVLALSGSSELRVGRLGSIRFDAPYYLYFGSAFGPGGLEARIRHHLKAARHPHWHIDYLRQAADVIEVWYSLDEARLECVWANMVLTHRDVTPVARFGSSDCRCRSHLMSSNSRPGLSAFQRQQGQIRPDNAQIRRLRIKHPPAA